MSIFDSIDNSRFHLLSKLPKDQEPQNQDNPPIFTGLFTVKLQSGSAKAKIIKVYQKIITFNTVSSDL